MPIKSQEEIHRYFEMNEKNYVAFYRPEMKYDTLFDYKIYHIPFKKYVLIRLSRRLQRFLRIDRIKKSKMKYMKGSQWFSITDDAAKYVVSKEKRILLMFSYTRCPDEVFLQTILYNSQFRDTLNTDYQDIKYRTLLSEKTMANLRMIDWPDELGTAHPRTFIAEDYDTLAPDAARIITHLFVVSSRQRSVIGRDVITNKCRKTNRCYHYGRYYIFHLLSHSDIIKPS